MAVIYCPQCDSEIPEAVAVCPSCGFNLDTYDENENNSEFNALLNAANKKLSAEAEEEEEYEEDDATNDEDSVFGGSNSISQQQIDQLLDGGIVDLSGEKKKKKKKKPAPKKNVVKPAEKPVQSMDERLEATADVKSDVREDINGEEAPSEDEKTEGAVPEIGKIQAVPKKAKKEKAEKEKKPLPAMGITVAAAAVALALGFCIALLFFGNLFHTPEEAFAIRAANAVNSKLAVNEQLCVYKAYVRMGSAADECVLYAITDHKDVVKAEKYRVVVNKDNDGVINIYYTVDETSPEYIAMKESDDPEVRVQASVLKNYSDSIENAHREISIGSPSWKSVDISEINSNITSQQQRETQD